MQALIKPVLLLTASLSSLPCWAACIDIGTEPFLKNVEAVTLCLNSNCDVATRTRSCGNVHYVSADYSSATGVWLFRTRFHDPHNADDDEHAILYQPVEANMRPLGKIEEANVWMLDMARPMQVISADALECRPESSKEACGFISEIAQGLRGARQPAP